MKMLTDKQEAFCQAYVLEKNGTQAAIDAGYSPHTAQVQASRLLANSKVRERVLYTQACGERAFVCLIDVV